MDTRVYLGVMDVLAMGNVGKAIIPMATVRYVCFFCMFLYSLAVFISLPKGGPEEEQKLMRKNTRRNRKTQLSNIKSGI